MRHEKQRERRVMRGKVGSERETYRQKKRTETETDTLDEGRRRRERRETNNTHPLRIPKGKRRRECEKQTDGPCQSRCRGDDKQTLRLWSPSQHTLRASIRTQGDCRREGIVGNLGLTSEG